MTPKPDRKLRPAGVSPDGGHSSRRDLIFVSLEDWDDIWRRNQFLCAGYARRYPQSRILFVGLPRDVRYLLRSTQSVRFAPHAQESVHGFPNIVAIKPLKLLPNSLAAGRKVNDLLFRTHIRAAAEKHGLHSPILWVNAHYATHLAGRLGESALIYDITDDWTLPTQSAALSGRIAAQDAELCRRADAVIVCSQNLFDSKRDLARSLHLIPNGVDAAHYDSVLDGDAPLPPEAAAWERPVLGYTGTVHGDRVDVALVESIARSIARGSIALVGPNHLSEMERQALARTGRVHFVDAVPYERIPEIMRGFDICITPHKVTQFTESLNPIKLWEYLAAGKPIVSTDVAGFRDYPQHVRIARDAEDFVRNVDEALAEPFAAKQARRDEAGKHSWDARLDEVERVIERAIRGGV